jgi:predicted NBD/HSP70 family sugar kinase
VDAVLREAAQGSPAALSALDNVGRWLGVGLAALVNIFNPQLIVLGGLCGRIFPFIDAPLRAEVDRLALRASRELVEVVPSSLGADAPLLGAAELAFDPFLADPIGITRARSAGGSRRRRLRTSA